MIRTAHGVMGVCGVWLEVVGESSKEQLVEDAALVDVQVVCDFVVTPGREIARMVVSGVETISAS